MTRNQRSAISNPRSLISILFLAALALVFVFPLAWMLSSSLRPTGLPPPTQLQLFAPPYAFENYLRVSDYIPLGLYLTNSLSVVALAVPLTLVVASWAGFALAQLGPRAQKLLLVASIVLLLVPPPALWVPRFFIVNALGLNDSLLALVAPALMGTTPFYVILFYLAFARVPREVYESARLDGANVWQTWFHVALPLARPAIIAVAVLSFAWYWSDYVSPLTYLRAPEHYTFPVGVQLLSQAIRANYPLQMAAGVMIVAPVVLVFAFAQKYFLDLTRWRWLDR